MVARVVNWPRDIAAVARSLAGAEAWFWLDGRAAEPNGASGLSYLGEASEVLHAERGREREYLGAFRHQEVAEHPGLGWVLALSYEFGVGLMGEKPAYDEVPPAFALRPRTILVLDHSTGVAEIRSESDDLIDAWLERHGSALVRDGTEASAPALDPASVPASGPSSTSPPAFTSRSVLVSRSPAGFAWRRSDTQYRSNIEACKSAIHEGDAYVLCLTDTAEGVGIDVEPLDLYLELLSSGPEIRGAVISAGDRALVSASPERFLSKRGNTVATHPIKGTRARGRTPLADAILAAELVTDPKERAENLMIVDLMRNDLSRVCLPGTMRTEGFLRVERHSRVHQLVSTVSGQLRAEVDVADLVEACFPGGSMTGAPKRRAVQILAAIEHKPRGLYSGCFGWIGDDGDAELAMTIRSIELRGRSGPVRVALVGAGGGITSDSDPTRELAEKQLKAASMLAILYKHDADSQVRTKSDI